MAKNPVKSNPSPSADVPREIDKASQPMAATQEHTDHDADPVVELPGFSQQEKEAPAAPAAAEKKPEPKAKPKKSDGGGDRALLKIASKQRKFAKGN